MRGGVPERTNGTVLKTVEVSKPPRVRIPPPPPLSLRAPTAKPISQPERCFVSSWNKSYSENPWLFGKEPSHFLTERESYFHPGEVALLIADGEGRNGVHLARKGLRVHAVDSSSVALRNAKKLAEEASVQVVLELADVTNWVWYENSYDHVIGILIQFADPTTRPKLFENMKSAVKPGGYLMLHGYRPEQIALGTGGPGNPDYLYTEELLRDAFADFEIVELISEDRQGDEGGGLGGKAALISLVARKPMK